MAGITKEVCTRAAFDRCVHGSSVRQRLVSGRVAGTHSGKLKFDEMYFLFTIGHLQNKRIPPGSLRACLHDSGMTFIPERVHSIPTYFSVYVYMIPRRKSSHSGMSSFRFSFRNEIFVLECHFILVSCKHRTNFVPREIASHETAYGGHSLNSERNNLIVLLFSPKKQLYCEIAR